MGAQFGAAALPLGLPSLGPFLRAEFGRAGRFDATIIPEHAHGW